MVSRLVFLVPLQLVYLVFFFGWLGAFYFRKQFLIVLLRLEFVVLGLFLSFIFFLSLVGKSVSLSFFLLILGACEASLGLSLLVSMVRLNGRDMLRSLSVIKC